MLQHAVSSLRHTQKQSAEAKLYFKIDQLILSFFPNH